MKTNISTAPGRSYSSIRPYSLQGLGGVIWAGCLLLLAALVPVNPRDITSDWQVAAAARAIGGGPAGDAFVTHVLVLLYEAAGCSCAREGAVQV